MTPERREAARAVAEAMVLNLGHRSAMARALVEHDKAVESGDTEGETLYKDVLEYLRDNAGAFV